MADNHEIAADLLVAESPEEAESMILARWAKYQSPAINGTVPLPVPGDQKRSLEGAIGPSELDWPWRLR